MKNALEITHIPIRRIKPSEHSARRHGARQRRKLKAQLARFGQVLPIVVDSKNETVIDGHLVLEAWAELGNDEIAVVMVSNRDEAYVRALRLALNRASLDTTWDNAKLRDEFQALLNLGFDLDLTGFDAVEIDMALSIETTSANIVEEEELELVEPDGGATVTKTGDIWQLGQHLLLCDDARDGVAIRAILKEQRAATVFADPSYNVRIGGNVSGLGKIRHREFAMASGEMDRSAFVSFLRATLGGLKPNLQDGAIVYVCMDWRHLGEVIEAGTAEGFELKNICVWVKSNAGMGTFYRSQHEFVFVFKHGQGPHQNNFELGQHGRSRSNVWNYKGVNAFGPDRAELLGVHPTVKPTALISDVLLDVSRRGDIVIDPFLGSGSTLLAAEKVGRKCVGIEIDPAYVDVAIRRWQKLTGKDAINVADEQTFDELAARVSNEIESLAALANEGSANV